MSVYDQIEALEAKVATLESQMTTVLGQLPSVITLTSGADLNTLNVGEYLIPNATVCATILNKPTQSNATAFVKVMSGGDSGQMIMKYIICNTDGTYFHRAFYSNSWHDWNVIDLTNSEWIDLPLGTNISAYSSGQKPQYRRVGNEVFVRGVYLGSGIAVGTTIATLPTGYRPSQRIMTYGVGIGMGIDRLEIETDGTIKIAQTTVTDENISRFHSFADLSFLVD